MTIRPDPSLDRFHSRRGGLGVFADFRPPTNEDYQLMVDMGFSDVVIGVPARDPEQTFWNPALTRATLADALRRAKSYWLRPHLMLWMHRVQSYIEASLKWCLEVLNDGCGYSLLLDCEGDYTVEPATQISPAEAALMINDLLINVHWGVTGLWFLHKDLEPLAKIAHYCVSQAYSVWFPKKRHFTHTRATFPSHEQRESLESWTKGVFDLKTSEVEPNLESVYEHVWRTHNKEFIMGNACYFGDRPRQGGVPELEQGQTMRMAFCETAALGVQQTWVWSWKHIRKPTAESVRRFFGYATF